MDYKKLIGYGFLIWLVGYLLAMLFVEFAMSASVLMGIVVLIGVAIAAYYSGSKINVESLGRMLGYSIGWVIIGLILNLIFTVPFTGWAALYSWSFVLGYLLTLIAPLFAIKHKEKMVAAA